MRENYAAEKAPEGLMQGYGAVGHVGMGDAAGGRQSAKGVLRDRIHRLRREAEQLEALAKALPEELPQRADQALWDLLISS